MCAVGVTLLHMCAEYFSFKAFVAKNRLMVKDDFKKGDTLTTPSMSVMSGGANRDWTMNLCLLFSLGS